MRAFDTVWQDVRYGARLMRRSPAFSITAIVVLALGIGVNTALFSVINSLFARDLHVSQPERLVYLQTRSPSPQGRILGALSQTDAAVLRDAAVELADFTGHSGQPASVVIDGETFPLYGEVVETNYFDLLGVATRRGRAFRAEDDDPSNPELSVVVSHDFWTKRLAADADAIGKPIRINGRMFRIIGIAPEGFQGLTSPFRPSMWWVPTKQVAEGTSRLGPIARLKPGVAIDTLRALVVAKTPELVRTEWERLSRGSVSTWPWEIYRNKAFPVVSIADVDDPSNPESRLVPTPVLAAVTTISALVLVVACANIAGLLVARGTSRTGEVAVRQALGAPGLRVFRQILTESLLLSGSGAIIGVGVAIALVRLFTVVTPETQSVPISIDIRVLVFAVGGALTTGVLVGLTPALQATRVQLLQALGSGVPGSRRTGRSLGRWIVVPQVTVSLVLLLVAAAHVHALRQNEARDLGYRISGTTVFGVSRGNMFLSLWTKGMMVADADDAARGRAFTRAVLDVTAAVSGVDRFALTSRLPLGGYPGTEKPVLTQQGPMSPISAVEVFVSNGYFDVMNMRVIAGRTFDERDSLSSSAGTRVAVVSASIARAFGGNDLVGRSIAFGSDGNGRPEWLEVIGVVNDVDPVLNDGRVHPIVYEAIGQQSGPSAGTTLLVRGRGDRAALAAAVRTAILGADASAEVSSIRTLDDIARELLYPRRLAAGILAAAAAIGLALACLGLYGIVSYAAAQRTRELGIRASLGATAGDIIRLVLRDGAIVLGAGIASGLVLGAIALRATSSVIRGLPTFDVAVFVIVPLSLVLVAFAACLSPALRASRIDPAQVIRGE